MLSWIETLVTAVICAAAARHYVHMFQLESYQLAGYMRYVKRTADRMLVTYVATGVGFSLLKYIMFYLIQPFTSGIPDTRKSIALIITLILFAGVTSIFLIRDIAAPAKKPLVFTRRARRLYTSVALVCLAACVLLRPTPLPPYLAYAALAYIVAAAAFIEAPYEKKINAGYFKAAQEKLASMPGLIKIGITGSYGKTSTKFALRDILSVKFRVLATPSSYNTPMGVSTVINNDLSGEHQVFIAEMGARHVGDIKELCDLVHPKYAMITSVGEQHLETFGTLANIANTKNEIMESLPKDGVGFFGYDGQDTFLDRLYKERGGEKYRAGFDEDCDMVISGVAVDEQGSRFTLTFGEESVRCRTALLGRHNISNIALAACMAKRLGMTMDEIARGVRRIEPVEHRLQLIPGDITVIDDAFNSNPSGAAEALNVLSAFKGRRIIVTPGMVEQGEREEALNYEFGARMKGKADLAILVGKKHTKPIYDGMVKTGFNADSIIVASDFAEATASLRGISRRGDVVLFENDLPDNYNE